jgi:hypothetical protein
VLAVRTAWTTSRGAASRRAATQSSEQSTALMQAQ